jgi:putative transposase
VRFAFVQSESAHYTVARLCDVMQVSRRGYYDWLNRKESPRAIENRLITAVIQRVFKETRQVYGSPRIYHALRNLGYRCGLNRVARLMREAGIVPKTVARFRVTTDSRNSQTPAPNLMDRQFAATKPNTKWLTDVTYIPTREGWLYLAAVLDLYSRKIVGWSMGNRLTSALAKQSLLNAIDARQPAPGLMVHSDQGREFYADDYQQALSQHELVSSMSRKGECYDNAPMESFFHTLKVEQVHHDDYRTRAQARSALFDYIELFYNRRRSHSHTGYQSPMDFERMKGLT